MSAQDPQIKAPQIKTPKTKAAIFISGRGSNMMALVAASQAPDFPLEFCLVLSNDPEAAGLDWARSQGLEAIGLDHRPFGQDRQAHEKALNDILVAKDIGFICLAGYMRILTPYLVETWQGRMINIHPALLPKYKGLHTHERALEAGDLEHGCSVHWVSSGVDEGAIIAQAKVVIDPKDTPDSLAAKVLIEEHKLYPKAIRQIFAKS